MLSEKIDVLQLAFYTAPVSSCVLLPFFWFLEVRPRPFASIHNSWAGPLQLAQGSLHTQHQKYISASHQIPRLAIKQWEGQAKVSVAAAVMIALVLHVQKDKFLVYAQENGAAVAFIVLLGSTVALAYNAVHNMLLKRTSSVAVRLHPSISPWVLPSSLVSTLDSLWQGHATPCTACSRSKAPCCNASPPRLLGAEERWNGCCGARIGGGQVSGAVKYVLRVASLPVQV